MATTRLVTWTPSSFADSYNVYVRDDEVGLWFPRGNTVAPSMEVDVPASFFRATVGVANVVAGIEADPDTWTLIPLPGAIIPAISLSGLTIGGFAVAQLTGATIRATWTPSVDPLVDHYEIRRGTVWRASRAVLDGIPRDTSSVDFAFETTGNQTYLLKAYGKDGQESAVASAVVSPSVDSEMVTMATVNEKSGGFAGTKTHCTVDGSGNLKPEALPSPYTAATSPYTDFTNPWWWPVWNNGTYETAYSDAGAVVDERIDINLGLTLVTAATSYKKFHAPVRPKMWNGAAVTPGSPRELSEVTVDMNLKRGPDLLIEINTTLADPATGGWLGWRRWVPGATYNFRGVKLRVTFSLRWPMQFPTISTFTWKRYRKNKKDEGELVISATGGTDITFATAFTAAPNMTGSLISATAAYPVSFSNITKTGCKARIFDDTATETTGTIHWHALGV